jgi:hypothetical protein
MRAHRRCARYRRECRLDDEGVERPFAANCEWSSALRNGIKNAHSSGAPGAFEAGVARRMVTGLLREGRISPMIGVAFLNTCLLAADLLTPLAAGTFLKILRESLTIGGWVAMWRPMQRFLYEGWPLMRRNRIYHNLGLAQVCVLPSKTWSGEAHGA